MRRKILAWALLLCMLASLLPASAFAESEITQEPSAPAGDGVLDVPENAPVILSEAKDPEGDSSSAEPPQNDTAGADAPGGTGNIPVILSGSEGSQTDDSTEPPLAGEVAAEQPEGSEERSPAEGGTAPLAEEPEDEPVRVLFVCEPEELTLTVYTLDENEEKQEIEPEDDGSYLLLPGNYYYDASCEGCVPVEKAELIVEASGEPLRVELVLAPAEKLLPLTPDPDALDPDLLNDTAAELQSVVASGTCGAQGDNLTWTLDDAGTLTISGEGAMANYSWNTMPWYSRNGAVKSLVIRDGVTGIGTYAFYSCTSLSSVTLTNSVTSIGSNAFDYCSSIANVYFDGTSAQKNERTGNGWSASGNSSFMDTVWHGIDGLFGSCGTNMTWTLDDAGTLTISGQGALEAGRWYDYSDIGAYTYGPWKNIRSEIRKLVIQPGVTRIGRQLFVNCANLAEVSIPDTVTAIDWYNFYGCSSLTSIYIPDSVTYIGLGCFAKCSSLSEVHLPENLTYIDGAWDYAGMFAGCVSLQNITLPSKLERIEEGAFYGCTGLASITVPSGLTTIYQDAFHGCTGLKDVYFSGTAAQKNARVYNGWSGYGNEDFLNAYWHYPAEPFGDIHSFAELKAAVAAYDGSDTYVFYNGTEPFIFSESITLPEHFYFCADADGSTVRVPAGVTLTVESPTANAFYTENLVVEGSMTGCRDAVVYRNLTGSVNFWYYGICGDFLSWKLDAAGTLTISGFGELYGFDPDRTPLWHAYKTSIRRVVFPEGLTGVGYAAFAGCTRLSAVELPANVRYVDASAFSGCSRLKTLTIPKGLWNIGPRAFESCVTLQDVYYAAGSGLRDELLDNGWTSEGNSDFFRASWHFGREEYNILSFDELKEIVEAYDGSDTYVFYNEPTTFVFEESITLPENLYFCADSEGSAVRVPAAVLLTVESITDNAFYTENLMIQGAMIANRNAVVYQTLSGTVNWRDLVTYGSCGAQGDNLSWKLFDDGTLTISGEGEMADFNSGAPWHTHRYSVDVLIVKPGVTSIGASAFKDCINLTDLSLPAGLTAIGEDAFCGCMYLTNAVLPDGLQTIGSDAFADGSSLRSLTIPASVTIIGDAAFARCSALSEVIYGGSALQKNALIGKGWSTTENDPLFSAVWHCTAVVDGIVAIGSASGIPGVTVEVPVELTENPGVSYLRIALDYDTSKLELTDISIEGSCLGGGWTLNTAKGVCIWVSADDSSAVGKLMTLSFRIKDDSAEGAVTVGVSSIKTNNVDDELLSFDWESGTVTVKHRIPGDLTGDGEVDGRDLTRLARFLAAYKVPMEEWNADVTGDGAVNLKDLTRLCRFLADYDVVLE